MDTPIRNVPPYLPSAAANVGRKKEMERIKKNARITGRFFIMIHSSLVWGGNLIFPHKQSTFWLG
jgi:hypothetical protein